MHIGKYTVEVREQGCVLLGNTLNGALLCLDEPDEIFAYDEFRKTNDPSDLGEALLKSLAQYGLLLEDTVDETALARWNFLERYRMSPLLRLLIYVTEDCNFRCVYCPQPHRPKTMPLEDVERIAAFLEAELQNGNYKQLYISWFGGEPLLNLRVIERGMERFSEICDKNSIVFSAGITTNAYLLSARTFSRLVELGITQYQITMDGMPETHDVQRPLKSGLGTWERIWENLRQMQTVSADYSVSLRVNANAKTLESAKKFIKMASEALDERFKMQAQPISNMGNSSPEAREMYCGMEEANMVRNELDAFAAAQKESFAALGGMLRPFGMTCTSFERGYYVVSADCKLYKCELQIDDARSYLGDLRDEPLRLDLAVLAGFTTPEVNERCTECCLYPLCYGLSCPFRKHAKEPCDRRSMLYAIQAQIRTVARGKMG